MNPLGVNFSKSLTNTEFKSSLPQKRKLKMTVQYLAVHEIRAVKRTKGQSQSSSMQYIAQ